MPRLYVATPLTEGGETQLDQAQAHYLKNVLRREKDDYVRLFNGIDGEWLCRIESFGKKECMLAVLELLAKQKNVQRKINLIFTPIKKQRMDFLIEKAVELGATDLHPVLTQNTEVRKLNEERIGQQIVEAAEQCERLDIPVFHELSGIREKLEGWSATEKIMICIERLDIPFLAQCLPPPDQDLAFLIGPEGGFSEEERGVLLALPAGIPVSLGTRILRSETAALTALALATRK